MKKIISFSVWGDKEGYLLGVVVDYCRYRGNCHEIVLHTSRVQVLVKVIWWIKFNE